jgi:cephalosporin-C deacetylase-like acetyl esterase
LQIEMTRRQLLALPLAHALIRDAAHAVSYRNYWACLPEFLTRLAIESNELRNHELSKLVNATSIRKRQQWVRDTFWSLIGGRPERTPLNVRTLGSFDHKGYRVEKLVYESQPNFHIPANLYIPLAFQPPFPGVLFQMGHTRNGKAGDTYQFCCQALAQLGYLVLGFDPMGQGERIYYPGADHRTTRLAGPGAEHDTIGRQLLLTGDTSTRLQLWDAVRSLDYLASHPLVDPHRIASAGQSGGATLTMFLAAVDDRLAAAAVCMGITENVACANFVAPGATDDAEQNFLASSPVGFDRWDLLYPLAPKPLWIGVSDLDAYGTYSPNYITNGLEEFAKLHAIYQRLASPGQLSWYSSPMPHGLGLDCRMQIYNFFERWLKHDAHPVDHEPPVAAEPDADLWVAESGNVVRTFGGYTPFQTNRTRALRREPVPLAKLLSVEKPAANTRPTMLGRVVQSRGIAVELIEFASADRVWLPAWLYRPETNDTSHPLLILLEPNGRNSHWRDGELYHQLALAGSIVCVPDIRGIGDLSPRYAPGYPPFARQHQEEDEYAWSSLIFGKPLLGQRVTDILAVAGGLRADPSLRSRKVRLAAAGRLAAPALFAAALDPAIDELYLSAPLVSYRDIVDTENYRVPFASFLPGVLLHTDLPEIAASLAPRRVSLAGAVNAAGATMDASAVQAIYRAGQNVTLLAQPKWDVDSLHG